MKKYVFLPIIILGFLLISAGIGDKPKDVIKLKKAFTSAYAYIPDGTVTIEDVKEKVGSFFMLKTEVSNQQYGEFLNSIEDENLAEKYSIKTEKWIETLKYGGPMAEHYHIHEAYLNYPVVNVTAEGAEAYCDWLT
jgi:formylglycine-generating enzyme required for sulfatase activity